jgi:DNA polymerase-3 subunit alpha
MTFGNLIDLEGQWINSVQFPEVATRYPFRGPGIYKLRGKVTEEFGHISLETEYLERIPNLSIETPSTRVADSAEAMLWPGQFNRFSIQSNAGYPNSL